MNLRLMYKFNTTLKTKQMKKLLHIVLVSSLSLLCFSCYYDEIPEEIIVDIPDDQEISFQNDIQPLFVSCTTCHSGSYPSPDFSEGNSYNSLVPTYVVADNPIDSRLYNYLPGNGHHEISFTLTVNEINLIEAWINQGAENN